MNYLRLVSSFLLFWSDFSAHTHLRTHTHTQWLKEIMPYYNFKQCQCFLKILTLNERFKYSDCKEFF